jgi:hypothetical protein
MRKLILLIVFLPLLCNAGDFGYSYEEGVDPDSIRLKWLKSCDGGWTINQIPVGIFKVYLPVSARFTRIPEPFEYNGLTFVFKQNGEDCWVENVREVPPISEPHNTIALIKPRISRWLWSWIRTPNHAEAWEIRCKAIEEIGKLKVCDHEETISYDGMHWRCLKCNKLVRDKHQEKHKYCPHCGKKLNDD